VSVNKAYYFSKRMSMFIIGYRNYSNIIAVISRHNSIHTFNTAQSQNKLIGYSHSGHYCR